jgi:PAS domain S-box-containing protein
MRAIGDRCEPRAEDDAEVLRDVLDATGLLIAVTDAGGRIIRMNRAMQDAMGGMETVSASRPIWELAAFEGERELLRGTFPLRVGRPFLSGAMVHLASGGDTPAPVVDFSIRVVRRDTDRPVVLFAGVNLSERLRVEEHLRETEGRQRMLLQHLPAVVWTTDLELRFTSSVGAGLSALGLRPGEVSLVGTSLFSYFHTDDAGAPVIEAHLRALRGEPVTLDIHWFGRTFQSRVEALVDPSGHTIGVVGVALDITERASAVARVRESEARFRRIFDSNMIGIVFWTREGRIVDANRAFFDLIGYTREDLDAGRISWRDLTPPEYAGGDEQALREIDAEGTCAPIEKEYIHKDGSRVPILMGGASMDERPSEKVSEGVAFVLDLRERIRLQSLRDEAFAREQRARVDAEQANERLTLLAEASKRLAATLRPSDALAALASAVVPALAEWSFVVQRGPNDDMRIVAIAHGDPSRAALARRLEQGVIDPAAPEGPSRVFRSGETSFYEGLTDEHLSLDRTDPPVVGLRDPARLSLLRRLGARSLLCVPVRGRSEIDAVLACVTASDPQRYDRDDAVLGLELANRAASSIENGRLLDEALDAVRAREDFLTVAAHELRTPLTSAVLQTQGLLRTIRRGGLPVESAVASLEASDRQLRRLASLVDGLLDASRAAMNKFVCHREDVDLAAVVRGAVALMDAELRRAGCSVHVSAPAEVKGGRFDASRMEQVVTNLLSNALKFGAGHPVEVTLTASGDRAALCVEDHGIGISQEDQARIFHRFERAVSTRHFGGLGLGLYLSAQIVRAHGGTIGVESKPGQGARFFVVLPLGPHDRPIAEHA